MVSAHTAVQNGSFDQRKNRTWPLFHQPINAKKLSLASFIRGSIPVVSSDGGRLDVSTKEAHANSLFVCFCIAGRLVFTPFGRKSNGALGR